MAGACLLGFLLNGCAASQSQSLLEQKPENLTITARVEHIPFFAQTEYQCGPAALAMMLNRARKQVWWN